MPAVLQTQSARASHYHCADLPGFALMRRAKDTELRLVLAPGHFMDDHDFRVFERLRLVSTFFADS
jgi:hypothetical protein